MREGMILCRAVVDCVQIEECGLQIKAIYRLVEDHAQNGVAQAIQLVPKDEKFAPTASSFTVRAILHDASLRRVLASIAGTAAGDWIKGELDGPAVCDLDQSWVRRQYAPGRYPQQHAPHGWHQDGALGFNFLSDEKGVPVPERVLSMVTCWIALGTCGEDAPGLEFITRRLNALLQPVELTDEAVHRQFPKESFSRPVLAPGDAVVFRGDLLHRTHVTSSMTEDRTSIELRFFPADDIPDRLKGDRFIPMESNQAGRIF